MNTLSEYPYFYMSKTLHHTLLCLFLKPSKGFSVSLNYDSDNKSPKRTTI